LTESAEMAATLRHMRVLTAASFYFSLCVALFNFNSGSYPGNDNKIYVQFMLYLVVISISAMQLQH